jgi:integrase
VWIFRAPVAVLRLIDASTLDSFRARREEAGDSANTATIRLYAVRTILAVAMRDGLLTGEQAQSLGLRVYRQRQPQDRAPVGRRLSPGEARLLREAVDTTTAKGARDRAVLDTMLYLGLRREEVAALQLHHFRQDGGRWWVVFGGKGGRRRRLKVHDTLFESVAAWLVAAGLRWDGAGPLFRSFDRGDHLTGRALDGSAVARIVARYGHAAGLAPAGGANQLSAHDLRRTCARNAFDNGASLLLVQAMLGHSDPKTTARYIGAFEDDSQTAVDFVRY